MQVHTQTVGKDSYPFPHFPVQWIHTIIKLRSHAIMIMSSNLLGDGTIYEGPADKYVPHKAEAQHKYRPNTERDCV